MIRFLFKQNQPKRFGFKPRYYDERKQYLETRVQQITDEVEAQKTGDMSKGFSSRMDRAWRTRETKKAGFSSNRNVLVIAGVLLLIAYLILR